MLGASCGLELSERILTEQRKPEKAEEVMAPGSSKEVSNSGVSRDSVRSGIQALFNFSYSLVQKRIILTTQFQGKVG